ncbi:MAG: S8 family serine peptidase [Parahaliea sp.]
MSPTPGPLQAAAASLRALLLALVVLAPVALALLPVPVAQAQVPCCMDPEDAFEDDIEEEVIGEIDDSTEQAIEAETEDKVEGQVEDTVEQSIEDSIQEGIDDDVEENVQASVEHSVEDSVQDSVESSVEERVEQVAEAGVQDSVEQSVEASAEQVVEAAVESSVENAVEQSVEVAAESSVESSVEQQVEDSVEVAVESRVQHSVESRVEAGVENAVVSSVEERLENEIDEILDEIENKLEVDEDRIQTAQWLVMAEPEAFTELARRGYLFDRVTELPGMGLRLAEVAAPSTFKISEVRQGVVDVVGSGRADVDLNHFYTAGSPVEHSVRGIAPRAAVPFPADVEAMNLRIGMIDSQVDTSHPSLAHSRIRTQSFVTGRALPDFHGTAIASIIAANGDGYQGLAPQAELYAAGVFEDDGERGEVASTVSLVRALDWLVTSGVEVVNVSIAGPPNRLLETALKRASERGVLILAAAGNGGPAAKPKYPAAYGSVVAVTAVDTAGRAFRLANRGEYLDIAAPGVGLLHARAGGGYATSSGTSFAVPFATTAAARLRQLEPGVNVLDSLYRSAEDLGPPGRDEIYGYGLLRPQSAATSGK